MISPIYQIEIKIPPSKNSKNLKECLRTDNKIGEFQLIGLIFTLGGTGDGIACNREDSVETF
jgi:carbamoylphosphate synthase large subunit